MVSRNAGARIREFRTTLRRSNHCSILKEQTQIYSVVREWLKAPDATVNCHDACAKKHPATGVLVCQGFKFHEYHTMCEGLPGIYSTSYCLQTSLMKKEGAIRGKAGPARRRRGVVSRNWQTPPACTHGVTEPTHILEHSQYRRIGTAPCPRDRPCPPLPSHEQPTFIYTVQHVRLQACIR